MEILSTGEKIKRSRIYRGLTLKDICNNQISVSKMSCIENDKVEPEDWVLKIIAEKLNLDMDYLKLGIREQIQNNISELEKNKALDNYEQGVLYNLGFADKHGYFDLCFKLIHLLFNSYLDNKEVEKLQAITSKYYEYCEKSHEEENYLTYYMDMARFLYSTREFVQAANYYNNVRKSAKEKEKLNILARATYNEAACYIMMEKHDRAYEIAVRLEELFEHIGEDLSKAEAYHMLAILSLSMDKGKFEVYESKSYELYGFDVEHKALAIYNYAASMFDAGINEKALQYIKDALQMYPKGNKGKLVSFMLLSVDELIDNNILEFAQEICDEALNYAIGLDNVKFIERAYYLKALILQKSSNLFSAEMYMNLSLDSLLRFGTKQEIHKRYMEMGYMYHKLGQTNEAIKYFNSAINLEKKM